MNSKTSKRASARCKQHRFSAQATGRPMPRLGWLVLSMSLLLASAATAAEQATQLGQPAPFNGELNSLAALNIRDAELEEILSGLDQPWAFEFADAQTLLITERPGRLLRFDLVKRELTPINGAPEVANSQEQTGLLDVEIHPDFANNRRLYLSYSGADPETGRYFRTEVVTAILVEDRLEQMQPILVADPIGWSPSNFGGALEFDDAGYLYISVGDRSDRDVAQKGARLQGKILRLHDDGRVPADNPFVGQPDMDARIWALGVRNPQGLHFDAQYQLMFEAEHGPMGGDEINVITRGGNYGWPVITYGRNYTTAPIGEGTHKDGLEQPLFYFLPSTAISPLTVYRGSMFPEWDGDLLVGALKAHHVTRLDVDSKDSGLVVRSSFDFLQEVNPRVRDIKVGPDGAVYVLAQSGSLYRLSRQPPEPATAPKEGAGIPGEAVYAAVCAGCHDTGAYQSPLLSDAARWQAIGAQPRERLEQHVFEGLGGMPPRGLCDFCSDRDLRRAIDYMLQESAKPAQP